MASDQRDPEEGGSLTLRDNHSQPVAVHQEEASEGKEEGGGEEGLGRGSFIPKAAFALKVGHGYCLRNTRAFHRKNQVVGMMPSRGGIPV